MVRILKWAIKIGVFLILLTPLVLGPFGISLSNFPKTIFFSTLTEIIFILYLLLVLFDSKYLPKLSILVLTLSIYLGVLVLTSLTGINFNLSFFGDLRRVEGVIHHLHFLVFFLVLISIFQKKKDWLLLFKTTVIVSALSSLAGILQKLDIFSFYGLSPSRISGTWTNPDFFAPYIVLAIFLAIYLLREEKDKNWRVVWTSILILNLVTLILSGTRAAWVGFGVGIIFLFSFWFFGPSKLNPRTRKAILFGILVLSILVLIIILNQEELSFAKKGLIQRALTVFDLSVIFRSSRLPVWQIAIEAWEERPIFGWGHESSSYLADKYFRAGFLQYIHFDRPHNKILEAMTSTGVIGLLSYLSIFFVVFYLLFRPRKSKALLNFILVSFFISYFVQNFFCFDTIGTYLLFFLVLGFINNNFSASFSSNIPRKFLCWKFVLVPVLVFLALITFYQLNLKPAIAGRAFVRAVEAEGDLSKALSEYRKGVSQNTVYDNEMRRELAARLILILDNAKLTEEGRKEIVKFLKELKPFLEARMGIPDKRYLDYYQLVGLIAERIYLFEGGSELLLEMEEVSKEALIFNSRKAEFYRMIGRAKIFQGDYLEGEEFFQKYLEFSYGDFKNEPGHYRLLGTTYLQAGNKPKAAENFQKALYRDFYLKRFSGASSEASQKTLVSSRALANIYYEEFNDSETALEIYQKAKQAFPEEIKQYQFPITD